MYSFHMPFFFARSHKGFVNKMLGPNWESVCFQKKKDGKMRVFIFLTNSNTPRRTEITVFRMDLLTKASFKLSDFAQSLQTIVQLI
jgi:hypothetical protein